MLCLPFIYLTHPIVAPNLVSSPSIFRFYPWQLSHFESISNRLASPFDIFDQTFKIGIIIRRSLPDFYELIIRQIQVCPMIEINAYGIAVKAIA
jgi:hypothetical protein